MVKNPSANAGDTGSAPSPGRFHRLSKAGRLSPGTTITEPVFHTTEATAMRSPHIATKRVASAHRN